MISPSSHTSHSLEDTRKIAAEWVRSISEQYQNHDEAVVAGLSGHLGAGKTAFTKTLAAELGISEEVTSPTFVIMKMYEIAEAVRRQEGVPWKRLVHIDAYRLERREELQALEWEKLVADPAHLILVEWPENCGLNEFSPGLHLTFRADGESHHIEIV